MIHIKWYKSKRGNPHHKTVNDVTVTRYGLHFGKAFVDNYNIHNYEYAYVGLSDDNEIIVKFVHLPTSEYGSAYKINFCKNQNSKGCFVAAASFVKGLPDTIYTYNMIAEQVYFDDAIFRLRFKEAGELNNGFKMH